MNANLEQKARRYRELAREVIDDTSRIEIEKLAREYEAVVAFHKLGQAKVSATNRDDHAEEAN